MSKFLEKKIYGFTILEILIGAFLLMNLGTIKTFLGLATKPVSNLAEELKANQIKSNLGLSDALAKFMQQASIDLYSLLHPPKTMFTEDVDEKALVDYILSKFTTASYWFTIKKYYKEEHNEDLVAQIKSCVTEYRDWREYGMIENAVSKGQSHFRELL